MLNHHLQQIQAISGGNGLGQMLEKSQQQSNIQLIQKHPTKEHIKNNIIQQGLAKSQKNGDETKIEQE